MKSQKGNSMLIVLALLAVLIFGGYMLYQNQVKTKTAKEAALKAEEEANALKEKAEQEALLKKQELTLTLAEENESGQSGAATLKEVDGKVVVSITMTGAPEGVVQPAHIHAGACPGIGVVKYPLTFPIDGASETTLDTTMDALKAQLPLAINVHKSAADSTVYVACADIVVQ